MSPEVRPALRRGCVRITPIVRGRDFKKSFYDALSALDESEETIQRFTELVLQIVDRPEEGRIVTDTSAWVLKRPAQGWFLPMRIFYWFDDEMVYFFDVDQGPVS